MSAKGAAAKRKAKKRVAVKKAGASSKKMPSKKAAAPKKAEKSKPAAKSKIVKKASAKKKAAKKKTTTKRATSKKLAPKKPEPKKPEPKKTAKVKAAKVKPAKTKPVKAAKPITESKKAKKGPVERKTQKPAAPKVVAPKKVMVEPVAAPPVAKEEPVSETLNAKAKKPGVLRVARGERRPTRTKRTEDPVELARAALAKVGAPEKTGHENGQMKRPGRVVEINPRLESSREKIEHKPDLPQKPPSVAQRKRQEAEAAFQKIAPQHNEMNQAHFHKTRFDVRISERDSLATQIRMSGSHEEALRAARELADHYRLPPDQVTLLRIVELGDERLTKLALEELLELDDKGRVRPTSDLITTVTAIHSKDAETIELKDLLLEKVGAR